MAVAKSISRNVSIRALLNCHGSSLDSLRWPYHPNHYLDFDMKMDIRVSFNGAKSIPTVLFVLILTAFLASKR
jgi:hypothetical protein